MLKARDLAAYRDLLVLFTRYGRKDFRLSLAPEDLIADESDDVMEPDVAKRAKSFAESLKKMGPTYVKFGQVLSTRPDIVPPEYIVELESLQDSLDPFSFAEVERIVEEELGARISKAFEFFDATPLAAASLGQVHRAVLRDGTEVVVKVQRPNVREQVRDELEAFHDIARSLDEHSEVARKLNLVGAIEQARITLTNELNYLQEARNAEVLRHNLAPFRHIYVPRVIHDMTTSRVLTTELVRGRKVSKLTPLSLIEHDYAELAAVLTRAYLKQICVDGFWHTDPHPGNLFIRDAGGEPQVVLLDFGQVSHISRELQDEIIKLLLAISSNRGHEVADACVRMSEVQEQFDVSRFINDISMIVANFHDADVRHLNAGQLIFHLIAIANNDGLKAPAELAMLGKTLLHLDGITKKLDHDFDPQVVIRGYAEELIAQKLVQKFNPRNFYPALLDLNQLVLDLPHRTREILDQTAAGRLTLAIKLTQAEVFLAGIHKIANRITVGAVAAALLISSTMLMRVPSRFSLLGYPGLAVIGYFISLVVALYLVISILMRDRQDEKKAKAKGT
ncbi:MAG TPA: AarF/UbiB family protein [Thermoanaerobaculia bacterium]|nr:AarF/UbiB family protein [Thermoanaerobaculia bacterium]